MTITPDPNQVYRDWKTDGDPSSGPWPPKKSEIRALLNDVSNQLAGSDARLDTLETSDAAHAADIDALEESDTAQDSRLAALETSDTGQDSALAALQAVFGAAGPAHAKGLVPDPGATPSSAKFLREDATFAIPVAGPVDTLPWPASDFGAVLDVDFSKQKYWWNGAERTTADFTTFNLNGSTIDANGLTPSATCDITVAVAALGGAVVPGSAVVLVRMNNANASRTFLHLDDGTSNERIAYQHTNVPQLRLLVTDAAVTTATINLPDTGAQNVAQSMGASYSGAGAITTVANGITSATGTGALPTVTTVRFGIAPGAGVPPQCSILRVILFSAVKTLNELKDLTAKIRADARGDVFGPGTSIAGHVAVFADASGKVIGDGGALPPASVAFYDNKTAAAAASIAAGSKAIQLAGYTNPGIGPAMWYKVTTPAVPLPGYFQSADGAYWEIQQGPLSPDMIGGGLGGDDAPIVMQLFGIFKARGGGVCIPNRFYNLDTFQEFAMQTTSSSNEGYGIWAPSPYAGGFIVRAVGAHLKFTSTSNQVRISCIGFGFIPKVNADRALWFDISHAAGHNFQVEIINVNFNVSPQSDSFRFTDAVKCKAKRPRFILNVLPGGGSMDDIEIGGTLPHYGFDVSESYQPEFSWNRIGGYEYALYQHNTGNTEGFHAFENVITGNTYGMWIERAAANEPGTFIIGNHINATLGNIYGDGLGSGEISGNFCYNAPQHTYTYKQEGTLIDVGGTMTEVIKITSSRPHYLTSPTVASFNFILDPPPPDGTGIGAGPKPVNGQFTIVQIIDPTNLYVAANPGDLGHISSGTVTENWSQRVTFDIKLVNAGPMLIDRNQYQGNQSRGRRHLHFEPGGLRAATAAIRGVKVGMSEIYSAKTYEPASGGVAPFYFKGIDATKAVEDIELALPARLHQDAVYPWAIVQDEATRTRLIVRSQDIDLYSTSTQAGTATAETDLMSHTIGKGAFQYVPRSAVGRTEGRLVDILAQGTLKADSVVRKTVRLRFGGLSTPLIARLVSPSATMWEIRATVFITTAVNAERYYARWEETAPQPAEPASPIPPIVSNAAGAFAWNTNTNDTVVKCTVTCDVAGAADEITQTVLKVRII